MQEHKDTHYTDKLRLALEAPLSESSGWNDYKNLLEFKRSELGERVLDIGAGLSGKFAREAAKLNIDVVSLSPHYLNSLNIRNAMALYGEENLKKIKMIAGLAQSLPFKDNTFDSVVSLMAFPYYLKLADFIPTINEIYRVSKYDSKIFLWPAHNISGFHLEDCIYEYNPDRTLLEHNKPIIITNKKAILSPI